MILITKGIKDSASPIFAISIGRYLNLLINNLIDHGFDVNPTSLKPLNQSEKGT